MRKIDLLKSMEFGERVAEEEINQLEKYFVETDQWQQIYNGNIDIVYGAKGTGKSALYALLNKKENELFDRNILLSPAENLRGATVFRGLIADPPPSEYSFIFLWKLYCLTIISKSLREYEIKSKYTESLILALETVGLLPKSATLSSMFRAVLTYFKGWLSRDTRSVEYGLTIDPETGMPTVTRKTEFREGTEQQNLSELPVEELLKTADIALKQENHNIWLLFDRLDVAFAESREIEKNALRALFRTY